MLLGISTVLDTHQLIELNSKIVAGSCFSKIKRAYRLVNYATDHILNVTAILNDTRNEPFHAGWHIVSHKEKKVTLEPQIAPLFGTGELHGLFGISDSSGFGLGIRSSVRGKKSILTPNVVTVTGPVMDESFIRTIDQIVGFEGRLHIERSGTAFRYTCRYQDVDPWICVPGDTRGSLPYGFLPPLEGEFDCAGLAFGGLAPHTIVELWEKLRHLLIGTVTYCFNLQGTAALIPRVSKLIEGPYINKAHGICVPCDPGTLGSIEEPYTCIPLGCPLLKSTRNEVWLDAIKVPGGWRVYAPATELPGNIPKKRRPVILAEISEMLQAPGLFPPDMPLPLDGRTF